MEKMFIYDNGELAEVQEKSFIFELAMEGILWIIQSYCRTNAWT
jgi:hypothetical protein